MRAQGGAWAKPASITAAYAFTATAWIALSDWAAARSDVGPPVHALKGLAFAFVTSALLFFLLKRWRASLDITTSELAVAQRVLSTIYDRLEDAVLIIGKNRTIVECSASVERVLGYSPSELRGRTTRVLHPSEAAYEQFAERGDEQLEKHGVFRTRHEVRHADGRILPTEHTVAYIDDGRGLAVSIVRDVSARQRSEELLASHRSRLETLLANVTDIVAVLDAQGRFQFVNNAIERVLGYPRTEVIGTSAIELVELEDRERVHRALRATVENPGTIQVATYFARHRDGRSVELETTGIRPIGGTIDGAVISSRDVSALRAAERELRAKESELLRAQKMEAVGRLAGGVAHDFNNSLTVILSYASFLEEALADDRRARDDLAMIVAAAEQAAKITSQLLLFSRSQPAERTRVDLGSEISELVKMLSSLVGEDVLLDVRLAENVPKVLADPSHVAQVVMNLVVNARDAMPHGGTLTIETSARVVPDEEAGRHGLRGGRYACIRVTDSGEGMTDMVLSRLFDPFFTTKEAGRGTGLGLSTTQGIVTQAGGWIDVESELGQGSTFRVYLPEVDSSAAHAREATLEAISAPAGESVLVVEDDEAVRAAIARLLRNASYEVHEANRPSAALELARREPVDLVITDVVMPEMNGSLLVRRLERTGTCRHALYMTGYTPAELDQRELGEAPILRKPFTEAELLRAVRRALDRRAPRAED